MQEVITLSPFEVGQLYALIPTDKFVTLSPELRRKLQTAFENNRVPSGRDRYDYAA